MSDKITVDADEYDRARDRLGNALDGVEVSAALAAMGDAVALLFAVYDDDGVAMEYWIDTLRVAVVQAVRQGIDVTKPPNTPN